MALFPPYLYPSEARNLKKHKYASTDPTLLDKLLNPWWSAVSKLVPDFIAPNILTLLGLVSSLVGAGLILYESPSLEASCPQWVWITAAVSFFLHQTFDCIDGKHARRIDAATPLGQLLDHGCDAITMCCLGVGCVASARYGDSSLTFIVMMGLMINAFLWTWGEMHTGKFATSFGPFGVTEGQFLVMFIVLLPLWADGIDIRQYTPEMLRVSRWTVIKTLRNPTGKVFWPEVAFIAWTAIQALMLLGSFFHIMRTTKDKVGALAQLVGFSLFGFSAWGIWSNGLGQHNPAWCLIVLVLYFAIVTFRAALSSTCKVKYAAFQWPIFPLYIAAMLYCKCCGLENMIRTQLGVKDLEMKRHVMAVLTVWGLLYLGEFIYTNISVICSSLDIPFWTVKGSGPRKTQQRSTKKSS